MEEKLIKIGEAAALLDSTPSLVKHDHVASFHVDVLLLYLDNAYDIRDEFCMIMAHKIALAPNNMQASHLARASGVARFAYNWALAEWKQQYAAWRLDNSLPKPSQYTLRRQLNSMKRSAFPWMLEVTKCAPQMAIINLGKAFQNFFAGRGKYPRFKKKGVNDAFTLSNDQVKVVGHRIKIPNLGWVRMHEALRFEGKILSATISRVADRWFASITVDVEERHQSISENQAVVGVDLGVSTLATLSTGEKLAGPKAHTALLKRLKRISRSLSRKQKGSANRRKAKARLARLHARISNIRSDALHKLTTELVQRFGVIGIENLNVRGMLRNRRLARSISDAGFHEFRRQLTYKADLAGCRIVVADRFFPSSKTCSCCREKNTHLTLAQRHWSCSVCGTEHDRDVNAAMNLREYAVSSTVSACGADGSGAGLAASVKPASMKQEEMLRLAT